MASINLSDRLRVAALSAGRRRRKAVSRALSSPFLRWRYGPAAVDQLLIAPQDLRTADPSFWREIELGQFGLAGSIAMLKGLSPFAVPPPGMAWLRALHGFGWLHHLEAAGAHAARAAARQLVLDWIARNQQASGPAWEPAVTGRRIISWLSHANFLLEEAEPQTYDAITASLGFQIVHLAGSWRDTARGYPRLLALLALIFTDLCVAGPGRQLAGAERAFAAELGRQILPDGGHISRNPQVLVELLLDLLPLRQCFAARGRTVPPVLDSALRRMLAVLRYLRLGDGLLARFNGMGVASAASLATVLAYDDPANRGLKWATASNYIRIQQGPSILVMDAGPPPPVELSGDAHAGCLSFEMSVGRRLLFVNGGAPAPVNADWRAAARATASHNTLCLAEESSSELVRHEVLERLLGAPPIRYPDAVAAQAAETAEGMVIEAHHNGYVRRFGVLHRRRLVLSSSGTRISGCDRLEAAGDGKLHELPFAIHFHIHPDAACYHAKPGVAAEIVLDNDTQWRFTVEGARLSLEESIFFADSAGPRTSLQIVLRGVFPSETEVRWFAVQRD